MNEISPAVLVRYQMEHKLLPRLLLSPAGGFAMAALTQGEGSFLVDTLNRIGAEHGYSCPYRAQDFVFKAHQIRQFDDLPLINVMEIRMPEPESTPLCARLYICLDEQLGGIGYYTVELDPDGGYFLCGWDNRRGSFTHCNYGPAPEADADLLGKVIELYHRRRQKAAASPDGAEEKK